MKIAVIGSGISGLCAAWLLGHQHAVTIYEKEKSLGMDAHATEFEIGNNMYRFDVPFRTFKSNYYPNMLQIFAEAGIATHAVDYSTSFSNEKGETYFRYSNLTAQKTTIPILSSLNFTSKRSRSLLYNIIRFNINSKKQLNTLEQRLTIEQFIAHFGYTQDFQNLFLIPLFSVLNTCSNATARNYPAEIIINYMIGGVKVNKILAASDKTKDIVNKLSATAHLKRLGLPIKKIFKKGKKLIVKTAKTNTSYDHVVVGTQANKAVNLLSTDFKEERKILKQFRNEHIEVLTHTDPKMLPNERKTWSPVNFTVSEGEERAMGTIWLNKLMSQLKNEIDVFQSVAPIGRPDPDKIISESRFDRPVMNLDTRDAIESLQKLQAMPGRRLWFCGSYAVDGIPLLESGAITALEIAKHLGVTHPLSEFYSAS